MSEFGRRELSIRWMFGFNWKFLEIMYIKFIGWILFYRLSYYFFLFVGLSYLFFK